MRVDASTFGPCLITTRRLARRDDAQQLHLDFYVDDLEAAEAKVLAACASEYEFKPNSDHCYVFADPAGHPFCLSTWGNPDE